MENKNYDALGNEINLTKDDFTLVQLDAKIHDKKFDTKPTIFLKDAFRRFCKNKSSVVGAIIIGILMFLAILVPFVSPYDIDGSHANETLMRPKLFEAGTGFWDGTVTYTDHGYDVTLQRPIGFEKVSPNSIKITNMYQDEKGVTYCDFVYDKYEDRYGEVVKTLYKKDMNKYIDAGLCTFDYGTGEFVRLSDDCPVIEIVSNGTTIKAVISQYRALGYDAPPKYLFGTDVLGRDLTKLAFKGLQSSLVFAVIISSICFLFGLIWGSISGYFGGNVDLFMERFMDILGNIPGVVIVTLFRLHLVKDVKADSLWVFGLALCVSGWMGTASRTRTQFYRFKGREYVLASRTLGASDGRLIFRHILPNALGTLVTSSVLMIPGIIFTESTYSYLGLGLQGTDSFGVILSGNQGYIQTYPMLIIFPAIIISLLMISFNLFGNGLRDALNPSLKGSE